MCQRAVGNVAAALVNVDKINVEWTTGEPTYFASSVIARRGFCQNCGTPLTFAYAASDRMDLTVGSLDDPAQMTLSSHFGVESRVPGWIASDELPVQRADGYAPLQARWASADRGLIGGVSVGKKAS